MKDEDILVVVGAESFSKLSRIQRAYYIYQYVSDSYPAEYEEEARRKLLDTLRAELGYHPDKNSHG